MLTNDMKFSLEFSIQIEYEFNTRFAKSESEVWLSHSYISNCTTIEI